MTDTPGFGARVRELRRAADLTLEALAERSGVSERTISDIERGVSLAPRRATVDALARGLGIDEAQRQTFLRAARASRRESVAGASSASFAPQRVGDFTGRQHEVASVLGLLDVDTEDAASAPAVLITGPPGFGKTTIAWEAVHRAADRWTRTLFVDLDGFSALPLTPLQVLSALLRQLPGSELKTPTTVSDAVRMWRTATASAPVAVLLDNAASESQVRAVLGIGPRSAIVITSRRSLAGLEDVRRMLLGPLGRTDSVRLLEHLIPDSQRDPRAVAGLAAVCEDTPLALRIVGNRIASRPALRAADFLKRLQSEENRLRLLVAGDLAVEAAISLSYDDVEPETAGLFRAISIIDGGTFDAGLAAAIVGKDRDDTEAQLEDLTDLGLLEARGADRFRLHDLLRLFVLDRLHRELGSAGVQARRSRLRDWLLTTLERAGAWFEPTREPDLIPGKAVFHDRDAAGDWIRGEVGHWWPAIRQAAALGDHARVVDVADSLHWFSDVWIQWGVWHEFFSLAVTSARALGDGLMEATHLGYVAWTEIVEVGDFDQALITAREALAVAEAIGDDTQQGWAHYYVAWAHWKIERFTEGAEDARASVACFRRARNDGDLALAIVMLATLLQAQGKHEEGIREVEGVLSVLSDDRRQGRGLAGRIAEYSTYIVLADSYLDLDRNGDAVDAASHALAIAEDLSDGARIAMSLRRRIKAHMLAGDTARAEDDIDAALEVLGSKEEDAHVLRVIRDRIVAERRARTQ
ncbi:helix-turn-helix domain-containing protein [Microbacterium rhizomatis]|uniref:Helix-turn-helix domain-containing protein n=1 Tax=Microbacterium rhizomatis TaxID=1631477 RepID=A0A5J5J0B7_9MICO|nr:helix-turn-helix domain-containing protein [Microbacterium rhizomatis]KAA9108082.1 helix-turn-helix domain-containing protein [Microbacterium rhizomatis]